MTDIGLFRSIHVFNPLEFVEHRSIMKPKVSCADICKLMLPINIQISLISRYDLERKFINKSV